MSEYELATLAIREKTLWVAIGQLLIGVGQIAVVWIGIRAMQHAGARRAQDQDQRHAESMTALQELIARTSRSTEHHDQRHTEAMTALHELIARTTRPSGSPSPS